MTERPSDPNLLEYELMLLAACGGISADCPCSEWMQSVGIAWKIADMHFLATSPLWAESVLPVADSSELVRRCLLWDPLYRLHADLSLGAVLHAVAVQERWSRFEQLLLGPFRKFAPRFTALVEWIGRRAGAESWKLDQDDWRRPDILAEIQPDVVAAWDEYLWGSTRPEEYFPLFETGYMPLADLPVGIDLDIFPVDQGLLLARLVKAAPSGDGLYVSDSNRPDLEKLCAAGIPVRIHEGPSPVAVLNGAVRCLGSPPEKWDACVVDSPLPSSVARSRILAKSDETIVSDFWRLAENSGIQLHPAAGTASDTGSWPQGPDPAAAPWGTLPPRDDVEKIGLVRHSKEADDAIVRLASHGVMGFWIQLLLLEALDRELGQETLMLAPPMDRRVEGLETATQVYYQPRPKSSGKDAGRVWRMAALGKIDAVLNHVAAQAGIHPMPVAHENAKGVWSFTLALLRGAELVQDANERWVMHSRLLDRLHGGHMMRDIIRRGQSFRDKRLHSALEGLWEERMAQMEKHRDENHTDSSVATGSVV